MSYNILAINPGHNGSTAFLVDGEIVYYAEEERLSRMKYDGNPFKTMLSVLLSEKIDELVIGGTSENLPSLPWTGENPYTALVRKFNPNVKVTNLGNLHHLGHASSTFYGSGFETAAAIVVDGSGSYHKEQVWNNGPTTGGYETETIYHCSYPNEFNAVYKKYSNNDAIYYDNGIQKFDNSVTITKSYEAVSHYLGFGFIEAGKTMGLSPYGQKDTSIPDFFLNENGNKNVFIPNYPAGAFIDTERNIQIKNFTNPKDWHRDFSLCPEICKNMAYAIQEQTEEQMFSLIQKAIDITGENNIVISGGYGLNCVANYKYLKRFPNINFYIDPISHDGGTAIGLAKYVWHSISQDKQIRPTKTVYLGSYPNYNELDVIKDEIKDINISDVVYDDISELIINGNIVCLFQGRAEGGPRALGNRSILFDPRNVDGKNIVNLVKGREWFRPFAGSIMEEHSNEWFEMETLKTSPFMMYAVKVKTEKIDLIPCVLHIDNTCRIQTVNPEENEHYYNLLNSFYEKTGVPLLFNTSFNLAGEPLVESLYDAVNTLYNSDIKYLYLPEIGKLITKL
jgi:carbamoyltransferase